MRKVEYRNLRGEKFYGHLLGFDSASEDLNVIIETNTGGIVVVNRAHVKFVLPEAEREKSTLEHIQKVREAKEQLDKEVIDHLESAFEHTGISLVNLGKIAIAVAIVFIIAGILGYIRQ